MKASYIWAGVAIIAIGVIGYLLVVREAGAVIVIKNGNREVSLKFDDNRIPYESLFQKMFDHDGDSFAQTAILANLEKKEIYHRDSPGLIAMLKKEHPDSKLSKEVHSLLDRMVGPFDRSVHTYYDITSTSFVNALDTLDYDHSVPATIRRKCEDREGFCAAKGIPAFVGFVSTLQPESAAVCLGSQFRNQELILVDPKSGRSITVRATQPTGACPNQSDLHKDNFVQISMKVKRCLFGDLHPQTTEEVLVYITPFGFTAVATEENMSSVSCAQGSDLG